MAGATCLFCAALPLKNRTSALTLAQCSKCGNTIGVTSYGATFRLQPARRVRLLSPMFIGGMTIGAVLFIFVLALIALGLWSKEQIVGPGPKAPPVASLPSDLLRVPEVAVADPLPAKVHPDVARQRIAALAGKIRNENAAKQDAFVLSNMKARPELAGLPFVMGNDCRLGMNRSQSFQNSVEAVREGLEADARSSRSHENEHAPFWNTYQQHDQGIGTDASVAALTQILGPERKSLRVSLVHRLKQSPNPNAIKALARTAVFESDGDVRMAAVQALKQGKHANDAVVSEVLMQGIRYPMAAVARRSARAMILLDRKDMLPQLVEVLGEPAPGDPVASDGDDKVSMVREVVRINHHRNCLLCHPPSQTGETHEVPGVIPIPGSAFASSPKEAYGRAQSSGEPMVRADTTYLRQDFSVMMAVADAAPWPEMQRFDFLVRNRVVEGKELATLQQKIQERPAGFLSENHKAVLQALTELSGQQNVAPTQAAWQRVLGPRNDE